MQVKLGLYQDIMQAYEHPKLFKPVKLKMEEQYEGKKFVLPVCIEAVPAGDCDIMFFVKPNPRKEGKHIFAPRKNDVIRFDTVKQAQEYIDTTLKPAYGERWTYQIWSLSALAN